MTRLARRVASAAVLRADPAQSAAADPEHERFSDHCVRGQPDITRPKNKIVPIRLKEIDRFGVHRLGHTYPDNDSTRLVVRVWAAHAANLSHDAAKRIDNFLSIRTPWMSPAERSAVKEQAFRGLETWSAEELGQLFGLKMAERTKLRLGSIAPIDCDAEARAVRAKELHRDRERNRRKRARENPKLKRPRARADAVLQVLPKVMEVPVSWICKKLAGSQDFGTLKSAKALRAAVHRELEGLERRGLVSCEVRLPERGCRLPVNFVKRVRDPEAASDTGPAVAEIIRTAKSAIPATPTNEREYLDHFRRRLAEFTPATSHQMNEWYRSERPLRQACGMAGGYLKDGAKLLFARHEELKASRK